MAITVDELLSYIPNSLLDKFSEDTNVDYQVKHMKWNIMFKLILTTLLNTNSASLRKMEEIYNSKKYENMLKKWKHKTRHSTIADRLKTINYIYFKEIFEYLSWEFKNYIEKGSFKIKKFILKKFDSTLVGLSDKLLAFGIKAGSPNERHIKFTTWMEWILPNEVDIYTEQTASSEEIALWETVVNSQYSKNSICLFDRWIQKRWTYNKLIDQWKKFISRLKKNAKYKFVKKNKEIKWRKSWELTLIKDSIIKLYLGQKEMNKELRLIKAVNKDTDKEYLFITNIMEELNASDITKTYKKRWDIEVFFRHIKQEFWFSHFVSRSMNWIMVMLYMTLITALLILIYDLKNKIWSFKMAKLRFTMELDVLLAKDIGKWLNWNTSALLKLDTSLKNWP